MRTGTRTWQVIVLGIGLGLSALGGLACVPGLGTRDAAVWGRVLTSIFLVAYGANRLATIFSGSPNLTLRRVGPSVGILALLGFGPGAYYGGHFQAVHGMAAAPSPLWITITMFWGLFAPGGVYGKLWPSENHRRSSHP